MSRRNGKPRIHQNRLIPTNEDTYRLCVKVEENFVRLLNVWPRYKGERLVLPKSLNPDLCRWRQMAMRFQRGDYRNTGGELKSLQVIAEWTVEKNNAMRVQPQGPPIKWKDG